VHQTAFFNSPNAWKSRGNKSRQYAGFLGTSHSMAIGWNSVGHMYTGNVFSELAHRAHDQQIGMLSGVLKYAANSPDVPLCDFHILGLSNNKHVLSRHVHAGVAQWFRQQPKEFLVRHAGQWNSKCLWFFLTVAIRSPINIRKWGLNCIASYTLGVCIYIRYVNLGFCL
jgi:hypothetical protein